MNLTRCSETAGLLALVAVLALAAGAFGALGAEFDGEVPDSAEVGSEVEVEQLTLTDPFSVSDEWTMQVRTQLNSPQLTMIARDGAGNPVREVDVFEPTTELVLNNTAISTVEFTVRGTVPEIGGEGPGQFDYENRALESINVLEIREDLDSRTRSVENGTFTLHRFTEGSLMARQAIDNASDAAEEANSDQARARIDEAITFYNNEAFEAAAEAAGDAERTADDSGGMTLLLVGGIAAILLVVGGSVYYLRYRQQPESKLQ